MRTAKSLLDRKGRTLPVATLTFDYKAYPGAGRFADVEADRDGSACRASPSAAQRTVEHLLLAMVADDGTAIEDATVDRLFCIPAQASAEVGVTPPALSLDTAESAACESRLDEAEQMNAEFLAKETDKLDAYSEDLQKAADAEIGRLDEEIKAKKKEMRSTVGLSVAEPVEKQRAIKKLEAQRDDRMMAKFERKRAIDREHEDILDSVQASLALTPSVTPIFLIRA